MLGNKINLLYVDDETNNLQAFTANFRNTFNLFTANSGQEGLELLSKNDIHVVLADQRMPTMTGVNFLKEVKKLYPKAIRILITAYSDYSVIIEAVNNINIFRCLEKPFKEQEISKAINEAYEIYTIREDGKEIIKTLLKANTDYEELLDNKKLMAKLILGSYINEN